MYCTSVSLLILLLWRGSSWVNLFISCDGEGELSIASPVRVYIIKMVRVRVMVRVMARVTHCFVVCLAIPVIALTRSNESVMRSKKADRFRMSEREGVQMEIR